MRMPQQRLSAGLPRAAPGYWHCMQARAHDSGAAGNMHPRQTVYNLCEDAGFPTDCGLVGRLDTATSGIILFTDDSRLNHAVAKPPPDPIPAGRENFHTKEYIVTVFGSRLDLFDPEPYEEEKEADANGTNISCIDLRLNHAALEKELGAPLTFRHGNKTLIVLGSCPYPWFSPCCRGPAIYNH